MNAVERNALLDGLALYDEASAALDERTLQILDRRRKTAVIRRRGWLVRRALILADVAGLLVAFTAAQLLSGAQDPAVDHVEPWKEVLVFLLSLPGWIAVANLHGLYERDEERPDHPTVDDIVGVIHLVTIGSFLFFAGAWLTGLADPAIPKLLTFWLLAIVLLSLGRAFARAVCRRTLTYLQNTVILGAGEVGQLVARKALQHPEYGLNLVGFLDGAPKERRHDLDHLRLLGPPERLPAIVRLFDIERVIVAFSGQSVERTLDLVRTLEELDVQVDIVPRFFELLGPEAGIHTIEGLPLIGLVRARLSPSSRFLKHALDLALSLVGLVLLSPVFVLVAIAIKKDSPGPVFFRQERMGGGDKTFRICKFRTMVLGADERRDALRKVQARDDRDPGLLKLPNDPRLTRVGRWLRRYSVDEFPQLWNVVRGEMSLVGPRPLPLDEDEHVEDWGRRRLALKPGITGLWQVLGRSDIPFGEMVALDYIYVTNWSLFTDLKLILRTIPAIFRKQGAY